MTTRVKVQQAIEWIKIHQIRRENAVISQQITHLRDEVANLQATNENIHERLDETRAEIEKTKVLALQDRTQIHATQSIVEKLVSGQEILASSLVRAEKQHQIQDEEARVKYREVDAKLTTLGQTVEVRSQEHDLIHSALTARVDGLQREHRQRACEEQISSIQHRLDGFETRLALTAEQHHPSDSPSRIFESVEERQQNICQGASADLKIEPRSLCQKQNPSIDISVDETATASQVDRVSMTSEHATKFQSPPSPKARRTRSTPPDDLDLDEHSAEKNQTVEDVDNLVAADDSLVMLPYQVFGKGQLVDEQTVLSQKQDEALIAYLERMYQIFPHLQGEVEKMVLGRFVDGLLDEQTRERFRHSLDATSWTKNSLENVILLYTKDVINNPDTTSLTTQDSCNKVKEPQLSVSATKDFNETTKPPTRSNLGRRTTQLTHTAVPRRSQRLAQKFQEQDKARAEAQTQTQSTGLTETESQADAYNAQIAEAGVKRRSRLGLPQLRRLNSSGLKTQNINRSRTTQTCAPNEARNHSSIKPTKARGIHSKTFFDISKPQSHNPQELHENQPDQAKSKAKSSTLTDLERDIEQSKKELPPQTPRKQIIRRHNPSKVLVTASSSPLQHKAPQKQPHIRPRKCEQVAPTEGQKSTLAPPLTPQSRLIQRKRRASSVIDNTASDPHGSPRLPEQQPLPPAKKVRTRQLRPKVRPGPRPLRKECRTKSPAPRRNIPILPPPVEGESQFDEW